MRFRFIILALTSVGTVNATTPIEIRISAEVTVVSGQRIKVPALVTKSGSQASAAITQPQSLEKEYAVPTGVTLRITPKMHGNKIFYTGHFIWTERTPAEKGAPSNLLAFNTKDFLFSGTATPGSLTRMIFPDKSVMTLDISLQDPEGKPLARSISHDLRETVD